MRHSLIFLVTALTVLSCSNADRTTQSGNGVRFTLDPSSTQDFRPDTASAGNWICDPLPRGMPGILVNLFTDGHLNTPELSFHLEGSQPRVGQTYRLAQPTASATQTSAALSATFGTLKIGVSYSADGTASACLSGCSNVPDPNGVVGALIQFSAIGYDDGDDIGMDFQVTLQSGKTMSGSISGRVSVEHATACGTPD